MKKLLVIAFLLPRLTFGANWFVSFVSGADANNGSTQGTAWKHMPGDAAATGVAAAATIGTGDNVYMKGGDVYAAANSNNIIVTAPTYSTAGFNIISGDVISWGSGQAIIDGNGVGNFGFQCYHLGNAVIQNIHIRNLGNNGQLGAIQLSTTTNCMVRDCLIHDIGTNNIGGQGPHMDGIQIDGQGANFCGGNIVSNCTIHDVTQKGIETGAGCTNNIFRNNVIYNCSDHGIVCSSAGNQVFGNWISNCSAVVWSETRQDPSYGVKLSSAGINDTHTNLVYNNIIAHCYGGVCLENIGSSNMYANKLFNNTFIDCDKNAPNSQSGVIRMSVRNPNTSTINGTLVENNLFCSEAANNTFNPTAFFLYCDNPSAGAGSLGTNNIVKNNLFFSTAGNNTKALWIINGSSTQVPSWANFSDTGSTSPDNRFKAPGAGSGNSFDSSSQFFDTDPKFVNYPTDLHLQPSSPVATAGLNLSAYFTTDYFGTVRVNWSIGAVDHLPAPPTAAGATISIGAGVNLGNGVKSL